MNNRVQPLSDLWIDILFIEGLKAVKRPFLSQIRGFGYIPLLIVIKQQKVFHIRIAP